MTTLELLHKTRSAYINQQKKAEELEEARAASRRPRSASFDGVKSSTKKDLSDTMARLEGYAQRSLEASVHFMELDEQLRDRLKARLPWKQADVIYYRDVRGLKWTDLEKRYGRTRQWLSKLRTQGLNELNRRAGY